MKLSSCLLVALLLGASPCLAQPPAPPLSAEAASAVRSQVLAALNDGVTAWNRGDLNGFMAGYLHSDEMTFTAAGRLIKGYDALQARYQQTYGKAMGKLTFSDVQVWPLGHDYTLAVGSWNLNVAPTHPVVAYHTVNPRDTAEGVFSLVLQRTSGGWKILHDHTSRAEHKP